MRRRYAGGNRLRTGAEGILAAERNSFAVRINEQQPAADPLKRHRAPAARAAGRAASLRVGLEISPRGAASELGAIPYRDQGQPLSRRAKWRDSPSAGRQPVVVTAGRRSRRPVIPRTQPGSSRPREYSNATRIKTNTLGSSDTELICRRLQFDEAPGGLIVTALPRTIVLNVSSSQALGQMRTLVQIIDKELRSVSSRGSPGNRHRSLPRIVRVDAPRAFRTGAIVERSAEASVLTG
jgi:Cupin